MDKGWMRVLLIAGTIGAGKSSLTDFLSKEMASKPFYENVEDNDVLPLFYSNPERYAFLLQIFFLNKSFLGMREALSNDDNVIDRSIYEDSLMFHLNADLGRIAPLEVEQYDNLLNTMLKELEESAPEKHPDLMVHIKVSLDTMIERISKRGRSYEQVANDPTLYDYYKELNQRYDAWYEAFDVCPKMQIDGDQLDFVENEENLSVILGMIQEKLATLRENKQAGRYCTDHAMAKGDFSADK
ncbi:deoxynucleoside kinase [Enterococcus sp. 8G7_MSG3316]|uniref:Deoxynucleoside kinase n=2 Tax=Candidatus Enterococcus testudinis TaxID=1834191 RepID=A0A242A3U7_9ENTE|nr:deoxynucleoside kinase [Enterococcus sp. 8G7_MSG3316]